MRRAASIILLFGILLFGWASSAVGDPAPRRPSLADILKASPASDWRALDPTNTLYLELPAGRLVMELAPAFAPSHVANIKALVRGKYFDGLSVLRAQDNYVVQWGDPDGTRPVGNAKKTLAAEFDQPSLGIRFTPLPDPDTYAASTGFSDGFPAAHDDTGRSWLTHCYGMLGVGRDNAADSGGGTELYVVIGHAPRHLDRNVTLVGRVVLGMEFLSTLRRGTGDLGFYEKPSERTRVLSMKLASDVPSDERTALELLRTDSPTFAAVVESRRNRTDEWTKRPVGHIEVCNAPLPARRPLK